ncbi:MAG: glycosyltransferase, partial [Oscillospiraceae bacterium]|nr:glycosyltransferase [Oscillospiraceae bacterium]
MKLSLIVPMYNEISIIEHTVHVYADYLGKTFSDWELIFVDDGSVDGSAAAVEAVHAPNTRVISYQPNR